MSRPFPISDDAEIIDVEPPSRRNRRWRLWLLVALFALFILGTRVLAIYVSALWFGSLGYSAVYWYIFRAKTLLFLVFAALTILILRGALWFIERVFAPHSFGPRTIMVNNQPFKVAPARIVRPLAWIVSAICGLIFGLMMKDGWQKFALFFHRAAAPTPDPIFNKPLSFYLFILPVYELVSGWLVALAVVLFIAVLIFVFVSLSQQSVSKAAATSARNTSFSAASIAGALLLLTFAWSTYLSRFPYLWEDHQTFSGVTYAEHHYLLPLEDL